MTGLTLLDVSFNQLTGTLPTALGALESLQYLSVAGNDLSGVVPSSIANLGSLQQLYLFGNQFERPYPSQILAMESLLEIDALSALYHAAGGADWDTSWLTYTYSTRCTTWGGVTCDNDGYVTSLDLSNNNLVGTLPIELGQLTRLQSLNVSNNPLTGTLPDVFAAGVAINVENTSIEIGDPVAPILPRQIVYLNGNPVFRLGSQNTLSFFYDTSDANSALNGLGIRVHIDSTKINVAEFNNLLTLGFTAIDENWVPDTNDYDGNPNTDSYVTIAWAGISGNWPGNVPIKLFDLLLTAHDSVTTADTIHVGFSAVSTTSGYVADLPEIALTPSNLSFDVDGNGKVDPLTDALMIVRNLCGFVGNSLIDRAVASDATYISAAQIQQRLTDMQSILDVDGNGNLDALTDGLLIMRYAFGFRGSVLINNAVSSGSTRTTAAQIEQYVAGLVH
jgi:hypothetical protein